MSRVEGAECQDYDECEAGVGRASGFRPLTLPHSSALFDTRRRVCKMKLWAFLIRRPIWPPLQSKSTCHRGGIGRRAWFRSMYRQRCGGSSPFDGTKSLFFPPPSGANSFFAAPDPRAAFLRRFAAGIDLPFSILISCGSDRASPWPYSQGGYSPTKSSRR